jgi:hypothetical protein
MLMRKGARERDAVVKNLAFRDVTEPAPHQFPIRRGNPEEPLE